MPGLITNVHKAPCIENLVGKTIQPGWKKIVQRAMGGQQGCTHITELMGPVATIAFQTIYAEKAKRLREADTQANSETAPQMSGLLNSCYALSEGRQAAFGIGAFLYQMRHLTNLCFHNLYLQRMDRPCKKFS